MSLDAKFELAAKKYIKKWFIPRIVWPEGTPPRIPNKVKEIIEFDGRLYKITIEDIGRLEDEKR